MTPEWVNQISERYIELFEKVTGKAFEKSVTDNVLERVEKNVLTFLANR
jgi:phosphoribosylaminoimidazole-succinocarboxamide synthase